MKKVRRILRWSNEVIMTSAVIVAAGRGTRMKYNPHVSKQHIDILGKSVILRTIEKFVACPQVDEIVLVVLPAEEEYFKKSVLSQIHTEKPIRLVHGGTERVDSCYNGIVATDPNSKWVVMHDGVRPFVKVSEIEAVIQKAKIHGAAVLAVKSKDTIKIAPQNIIEHTPDRENMYLIQTPQAFERQILLEAYQHLNASQNAFLPTDDASVVERFGAKVHIVEGSYENIKITTVSDIILAEAILRSEELLA